MAKSAALGAVIEFQTPKGLAYAQYTHRHGEYGDLLRILPGLFPSRPGEFSDLVGERERFHAFFPLRAALAQNIVEVVAVEDVPEHSQPFPTFKSGVVDPATGKVSVWWLWDGDREWSVTELDEEQRDLSPEGLVNDTLLIERIASGWSPRDQP